MYNVTKRVARHNETFLERLPWGSLIMEQGVQRLVMLDRIVSGPESLQSVGETTYGPSLTAGNFLVKTQTAWVDQAGAGTGTDLGPLDPTDPINWHAMPGDYYSITTTGVYPNVPDNLGWHYIEGYYYRQYVPTEDYVTGEIVFYYGNIYRVDTDVVNAPADFPHDSFTELNTGMMYTDEQDIGLTLDSYYRLCEVDSSTTIIFNISFNNDHVIQFSVTTSGDINILSSSWNTTPHISELLIDRDATNRDWIVFRSTLTAAGIQIKQNGYALTGTAMVEPERPITNLALLNNVQTQIFHINQASGSHRAGELRSGSQALYVDESGNPVDIHPVFDNDGILVHKKYVNDEIAKQRTLVAIFMPNNPYGWVDADLNVIPFAEATNNGNYYLAGENSTVDAVDTRPSIGNSGNNTANRLEFIVQGDVSGNYVLDQVVFLARAVTTTDFDDGPWDYSAAGVIADPGLGGFQFDNADPLLATQMAISLTNADGFTYTFADVNLDIHDEIYIQQANNANRYIRYRVQTLPTDNVTWMSFNVTIEDFNLTLQDTQRCNVLFFGDDKHYRFYTAFVDSAPTFDGTQTTIPLRDNVDNPVTNDYTIILEYVAWPTYFADRYLPPNDTGILSNDTIISTGVEYSPGPPERGGWALIRTGVESVAERVMVLQNVENHGFQTGDQVYVQRGPTWPGTNFTTALEFIVDATEGDLTGSIQAGNNVALLKTTDVNYVYVTDVVSSTWDGVNTTITVNQQGGADPDNDCNLIYYELVTWQLAQADDAGTLKTAMVLRQSANFFYAVMYGSVIIENLPLQTYRVGQIYYLSTTTAGGVQPNPPTTAGLIEQAAFEVINYFPVTATAGNFAVKVLDWRPRVISAIAGAGSNFIELTSQVVATGVNVGEFVYLDGAGIWQKAMADSETTLKLGVVADINAPPTGDVTIITYGQVELTTGIGTLLNVGETYFLSDTVAGGYQEDPPFTRNHFVQAVFEVISVTDNSPAANTAIVNMLDQAVFQVGAAGGAGISIFRSGQEYDRGDVILFRNALYYVTDDIMVSGNEPDSDKVALISTGKMWFEDTFTTTEDDEYNLLKIIPNDFNEAVDFTISIHKDGSQDEYSHNITGRVNIAHLSSNMQILNTFKKSETLGDEPMVKEIFLYVDGNEYYLGVKWASSQIVNVRVTTSSLTNRNSFVLKNFFVIGTPTLKISRIENLDTEHGLMASNAIGGGGDATPVGTIIAFASYTPPTGYLLCNGQTFDATQYPELAALLGQNKTPNLIGHFVRGAANQAQIQSFTQHNDLTRAPRHGGNPLSNAGSHQHDTRVFSWDGGLSHYFNASNAFPSVGVDLSAYPDKWYKGNRYIWPSGDHTHQLQNFDAETVPKHVYMAYMIKAVPVAVTTTGGTGGAADSSSFLWIQQGEPAKSFAGQMWLNPITGDFFILINNTTDPANVTNLQWQQINI